LRRIRDGNLCCCPMDRLSSRCPATVGQSTLVEIDELCLGELVDVYLHARSRGWNAADVLPLHSALLPTARGYRPPRATRALLLSFRWCRRTPTISGRAASNASCGPLEREVNEPAGEN